MTTYQTQAIKDFIYASYNTTVGSTTLNNIPFNGLATVNDWNSTTPTIPNAVVPRDFYINVVGTSCRTCHLSRSDDNLWFDTQNKFLGVFQQAVCGTTKYMPNAKVTFVNFWTNGAINRPDELRKYLNMPICD